MSKITEEQMKQFTESMNALTELDKKITEIEQMDPEYQEMIRKGMKPFCDMIIEPFINQKEDIERNLEASIRMTVEEAKKNIFKALDHVRSFANNNNNNIEDIKEVKSE